MFTVFGRQGEKLIGASVRYLVKYPDMDPQCIHPLMERVIGKTKIFQVLVRKSMFDQNTTIME